MFLPPAFLPHEINVPIPLRFALSPLPREDGETSFQTHEQKFSARLRR